MKTFNGSKGCVAQVQNKCPSTAATHDDGQASHYVHRRSHSRQEATHFTVCIKFTPPGPAATPGDVLIVPVRFPKLILGASQLPTRRSGRQKGVQADVCASTDAAAHAGSEAAAGIHSPPVVRGTLISRCWCAVPRFWVLEACRGVMFSHIGHSGRASGTVMRLQFLAFSAMHGTAN